MNPIDPPSIFPLSDMDLDQVTGGITAEDYAPIKEQLDNAVTNDDFCTFKSIVCSNFDVYGPVFLAKVLSEYWISGYLTHSRYLDLSSFFVGLP